MTSSVPKDIRSTGRKRARAKLFKIKRLYVCAVCGVSTNLRPPEAPNDFEDFWPNELETGLPAIPHALHANHINKNLLDVDPVNLEWLCPKCHKNKDLQSGVGESVLDNEFGY
jgi:rubredoxin